MASPDRRNSLDVSAQRAHGGHSGLTDRERLARTRLGDPSERSLKPETGNAAVGRRPRAAWGGLTAVTCR
jgi:hypothetical protein